MDELEITLKYLAHQVINQVILEIMDDQPESRLYKLADEMESILNNGKLHGGFHESEIAKIQRVIKSLRG